MWKHRYLAINSLYFEGENGMGTPAGGAEGPWFAKMGVAQEHHEWLGAKQFADPNLQIASHRSLEGLIGRERLAVPKDDKDVDAYDKLYKTLGRPDKPDGYKLKEGSKISGDQWKFFAPIFHEVGIGQKQAERILDAYEGRAGELEKAAEVEKQNRETAEISALEKEWGSALQANTDVAARAFRALGIDEATSSKIEDAIGYQATMKLFHAIGSGMSEAAFKQDGNKGGNQEKGGLQAQQAALKAKFDDKEFMKKYMSPDPRVRKDAIAEVEVIQKRIADLTGGVGG